MSENCIAFVPGEQLSSRPWLRKVGGQVVRYVRGSIEDRGVKMLRTIDDKNRLNKALNNLGSRHSSELCRLASYGVNIVPAKVETGVMPYFADKHSKPVVTLAMRIVSDFVEGGTLHEANKDVRLDLIERVQRYLDDNERDKRPFLGDLFWHDQYVAGSSQAVLVDVDPLYAMPTSNNFVIANAQLEKMAANIE